LTTKIHLACDARGLPVEILLGPGQEPDIKRAEENLGEHKPKAVIADKAYDSNRFVDFLEQRDTEVVIPPLRCRTEQREYSKDKYKQRNLIERLINRLKHYRRVATRYEKTARNFLAFTQLAATLVTLGVNVNMA
jgi:transposase